MTPVFSLSVTPSTTRTSQFIPLRNLKIHINAIFPWFLKEQQKFLEICLKGLKGPRQAFPSLWSTCNMKKCRWPESLCVIKIGSITMMLTLAATKFHVNVSLRPLSIVFSKEAVFCQHASNLHMICFVKYVEIKFQMSKQWQDLFLSLIWNPK